VLEWFLLENMLKSLGFDNELLASNEKP